MGKGNDGRGWVSTILGEVFCPEHVPEDAEEPRLFTDGLARAFLRLTKVAPMCCRCAKEHPACAS